MRFPERGIKLHWVAQGPKWSGLIKGGWIEVPANKDVGLPKPVYIYIAWWKRMLWILKALARMEIEIRVWPWT